VARIARTTPSTRQEAAMDGDRSEQLHLVCSEAERRCHSTVGGGQLRLDIRLVSGSYEAPCALAVGDAEQAASRSKAASLSLRNDSRRPIFITTIIVD